MFDFAHFLELDRVALDLLARDVRAVDDVGLLASTPCAGWNVNHLLLHMNHEHAAVSGGGFNPGADQRIEFVAISQRWSDFFADKAEAAVRLPKMDADLPSNLILAAHFADMLVHRWDLAVSLGRPCPTDEALTAEAQAVAEVMTDPNSPLVGEGGVYAPRLAELPDASPLENLVSRYGRDPGSWRGPA